MTRASLVACLLYAGGILAVVGSPMARAENGISVFGGWRASGGLEDATSGHDVHISDSAAVSVALDLTFDESRQIQIFGSYQHTSMTVTPTDQPATSERLSLKVAYLHIGGTNFFAGPVGRGAYVAGGLGVTLLSPGLNGLESEVRPSLSLGLGYVVPVAGSLALRLEGRGYFTLVDSSGGLFCSGGCTVAIKGKSLTQGEAMLGLTWRF